MESYDEFVQDMWFGEDNPDNLAIAALGLVGEAGEVAEKVKKHLRGDAAHNPMEHPDILIRNAEIGKELGDVAFYLTWLANYHGFTLNEVLKMNMDKLNKRRAGNVQRGDGDNR